MRILIVDGDSRTRLAIQMYLHQELGMYVTGMATQMQGLVAQAVASQPDVLLIDRNLPGASTQDSISEILRLSNPPKVVVLSADPKGEVRLWRPVQTRLLARMHRPKSC